MERVRIDPRDGPLAALTRSWRTEERRGGRKGTGTASGSEIMSFRFSRSRWCLCRAALRPGARDPRGDPRVLLELEEAHPIGPGKRTEHRDNCVQFRASRVTCCMSVHFRPTWRARPFLRTLSRRFALIARPTLRTASETLARGIASPETAFGFVSLG